MNTKDLASSVAHAWLWSGDRGHLRFTSESEHELASRIEEVLNGTRNRIKMIQDIVYRDTPRILRVRDSDTTMLHGMIELAEVILRQQEHDEGT